jgi:YesN/AraC family two-component response regulator
MSALTEHITAVRIRRAKNMLASRTLSVADIAENTGFCDVQYFGKLFKRETGVSALQFKKCFIKRTLSPACRKSF